eukprot:8362213-Alexandrium_andersonii.AAC.1
MSVSHIALVHQRSHGARVRSASPGPPVLSLVPLPLCRIRSSSKPNPSPLPRSSASLPPALVHQRDIFVD